MKFVEKQKLEHMGTAEYRQEQEKRLEKIKNLRNRDTIKTSEQYLAMLNGVCGEKRIESRKRIDARRFEEGRGK